MDIALLVEQYLADKKELITPEDSINLALLQIGDLSGWRYANIPCPPLEDIGIILGGE